MESGVTGQKPTPLHIKPGDTHTELQQVTGTGVTSGREALFPSFIRCFGVPLEPQLSLCMDFIAVRLHSGEGIHGHILTNKKAL